MSAQPSGQMSRKEIRTGQVLNGVATVGGLNAMRMAVNEFKHSARLSPEQAAAKVARSKTITRLQGMKGVGRLVKNPRATALALGGGALALHGGELAGDAIAARSLHHQARSSEQGISKAYVSPVVRTTGRGVNIEKAWKKPQEQRDTVFFPGHGYVNGTFIPHRNSGKYRALSATGTGVVTGIGAGILTSNNISSIKGRAAAAGAGALLGAGLGYGQSKWGRRFEIDKDDIKAIVRRNNKVVKAYRRFDPEADRQRRLGTYSGLAGGAGIVAGGVAAHGLKPAAQTVITDLKTMPKPLKRRVSRGGLAAIGAAGLFAGGAHAYRRGIQVRNQPWT